MAEDTGQERTEEPTGKRLRDARERGQIPTSRELNTILMLLLGGAAVMAMSSILYEGIRASFELGLSVSRETIFDRHGTLIILERAIVEAAKATAPVLGAAAVIAVLGPVIMGGLSFSPSVLSFKWERLDPLTNFKRIFGVQALMELLKSIAKFGLVLAGTFAFLWHFKEQVMGLGREPVTQGIAHAMQLMAWTFIATSACLVLVAAVDAPFQLWNYKRQLRMTRQEIRDEMKDTEGKPEVKRKVREVQMEMAQRRMMTNVPKADVVITNPTHYAVALKYDPKTMAAPVVVAKGADAIAAEIRRIAVESKVMLTSAPPLARALYHSTDIDEPIPMGLYKAVAMVLAYVFQVRRKRWTYNAQPLVMQDLPIPDDLRKD